MKIILLINILLFQAITNWAQGLEKIIVEKYYTGTKDKQASPEFKKMTSYRIYIKLSSGYKLQAVYGNEKHPLNMETTTSFYNQIEKGNLTGNKIKSDEIKDIRVALDSWITIGAASDKHIAVPLSEDKDGSLIQSDFFSKADGLIRDTTPNVIYYGLDMYFVSAARKDNSLFSTKDGAWAVLGGIQGCSKDNTALIAQISTDGQFSFELNIQLGAPDGRIIKYVARNPEDGEILCKELIYGK